jgi:hypothetical protein
MKRTFSLISFIAFISLTTSAMAKPTWKLSKHIMPDQKIIIIGDEEHSFQLKGYECSVFKVFTPGKVNKQSWYMRTLECKKDQTVVSSDISCGGTHGKSDSGGFSVKVGGAAPLNPFLICEE